MPGTPTVRPGTNHSNVLSMIAMAERAVEVSSASSRGPLAPLSVAETIRPAVPWPDGAEGPGPGAALLDPPRPGAEIIGGASGPGSASDLRDDGGCEFRSGIAPTGCPVGVEVSVDPDGDAVACDEAEGAGD